jgi:hypothetical protein
VSRFDLVTIVVVFAIGRIASRSAVGRSRLRVAISVAVPTAFVSLDVFGHAVRGDDALGALLTVLVLGGPGAIIGLIVAAMPVPALE